MHFLFCKQHCTLFLFFQCNYFLMINFDRNAIGDYVYMYSSEAETKHNQFFYDVVKENNLCIADLPAFKSQAYSFDFSNYLYLHEANYADSQMFLNEGINIINFVSMNFKTFEVVSPIAFLSKFIIKTILSLSV